MPLLRKTTSFGRRASQSQAAPLLSGSDCLGDCRQRNIPGETSRGLAVVPFCCVERSGLSTRFICDPPQTENASHPLHPGLGQTALDGLRLSNNTTIWEWPYPHAASCPDEPQRGIEILTLQPGSPFR